MDLCSALFTLVEPKQDCFKKLLKLSKQHAESLTSSGNEFQTV